MPPERTGIYSKNRASEWPWLEIRETHQNCQNVHGFQVRTPICHIVPVSRAYGYMRGGGPGSIHLEGQRMGCWRGAVGTGDLTSSIRVLKITPLILTYHSTSLALTLHPLLSRKKLGGNFGPDKKIFSPPPQFQIPRKHPPGPSRSPPPPTHPETPPPPGIFH